MRDRSIYVAGGSSERVYVASLLAELRAAGWVIAYDWTTDPGWADPTYPRQASALSDVAAVLTARTFWLVLPPSKSEGAHFELGVAVATALLLAQIQSREVVVSGPHSELGRLFPSLAERVFDTHEEALAYLRGRAFQVAA